MAERSDGVNTRELLGAYLSGDLRPEEREAVERLLASDSDLRAELESLRDVLGSVNALDVGIPEALSHKLRERLVPFLADEATAAALGAALAGDMSASEREILKRYFREHPQEKARMATARQTGAWMASQQPRASDALSNALRERLAEKIPSLRRENVSRETTLVKTPPLLRATKPAEARPLSQSLRVVAKDDPWKRRMAWAAGAAATVALAFGIARVFTASPTNLAKSSQPKDGAPGIVEGSKDGAPETHEAPRIPTPEVVQGEPLLTPPVQQNRVVEEQPRPVQPLLPEVTQGPKPLPNVVKQDPPRSVPQPRDTSEHGVQPRQKPAPDVAVEDPAKTPKPVPDVPQIVPNTPNTDPRVVENRSSTGGVPMRFPTESVTPPRPPADTVTTAKPDTNPGLNPGDGPAVATGAKTTEPAKAATADATSMVIASVSGGSVEARPEVGNPQTLTSNQGVGLAFGSGSELITSETSRVSVDLPDGRLWVNVSSRVRVTFGGGATTVDLFGGQIAYEASKGSLTVVTAKEAVVTNAKNVDVRIENGAVVASVLGETAKVKNKTVNRGQQATVSNPASADAPKIAPLSEAHTGWRTNDPQRTTTGEQPAKGKSKSTSRKR